MFGYGDLLQAFSTVDLLENGAPGGGPTYDGDRHFDYKPLRTENMDGVWESALANMELYLALREKARAFRADPEVQEALEAARVAELTQPTLDDGESYDELLADRGAFEDFDIDRGPTQGYGFARISGSPSSTCSASADPPIRWLLADRYRTRACGRMLAAWVHTRRHMNAASDDPAGFWGEAAELGRLGHTAARRRAGRQRRTVLPAGSPTPTLNTCYNALDRHVDRRPRRPGRADLRQPGHRHRRTLHLRRAAATRSPRSPGRCAGSASARATGS